MFLGIDPHHLWLSPTANGTSPTPGMTLPGLLIDLGTVARDGASFSAVPLIRCDEPNPAVAVLVVVPLNECCHPCAGFLHALEGPSGVVGPVFDRAEQRFRKGVVVAHPGSGEGSEHSQLFQAALQRGLLWHCRCPHGGPRGGVVPC